MRLVQKHRVRVSWAKLKHLRGRCNFFSWTSLCNPHNPSWVITLCEIRIAKWTIHAHHKITIDQLDHKVWLEMTGVFWLPAYGNYCMGESDSKWCFYCLMVALQVMNVNIAVRSIDSVHKPINNITFFVNLNKKKLLISAMVFRF